ncbi:Smr/MutS family protein [Wenxinia saemankumensis]|uniref:DNA-nicking endonuclease, Smr domain n=1 Tax=Wenxinia saemankumensis TaxID=1447782 RepID=A0A1M6G2H8_9RHOB|nr:Smr/MutS family protein [Wenxinia saemankumensis]SHJ04173.1 DNA-nicking endonuclease, Smr domain [Wenxinia saemankumensis]
MRRPRHLSPEERALWDRVAKSADPLDRARAATEGTPPPPKAPPARVPDPPAPPAAPLPSFRVGERASPGRPHDLQPTIAERVAAQPVRMDAKTHKRLSRGKTPPDARIDLHGMTLAQAHSALVAFVLSSQMNGRRHLLVITGKGRARDELAPMPVVEGALRHQVPHWLELPPLDRAVLQVTQAHQRHGGAGAYYVTLRRRR